MRQDWNHRLVVCAAAGLALALSETALAAPAAAWPESLSCTFDGGRTWSYEAGTFSSKEPAPLSFDIGSIDLEGQAAVLGLGGGTTGASLRIVRAINANHFLEVVNEGFLNLTTVYDADPATGLHPAVHSRHFGLLGQPVFAQYTGTCRPGGAGARTGGESGGQTGGEAK